ncbi:unnamed protein product [Meloidogyne enterolobii]|uniref:Uncharacterized protein n=2 Tax=Meloidogyne enterolobii TaxID=390850 RepID=A0ACB1B4W3_MELEN|nr:unnamed protein product [Meloidogyne enterolobii]
MAIEDYDINEDKSKGKKRKLNEKNFKEFKLLMKIFPIFNEEKYEFDFDENTGNIIEKHLN